MLVFNHDLEDFTDGQDRELMVALGDDVVVPVGFDTARVVLGPFEGDNTFMVDVMVTMTTEQLRTHFPHALDAWNAWRLEAAGI
jgi:hypothetical protein